MLNIQNQCLQSCEMKSELISLILFTRDESWFLFEYHQSLQWVLSKEDLIEKTRRTNMEKKIMLTFFSQWIRIFTSFTKSEGLY